jgi:TRAP-type C4-dicarboxylate transport system substrate-binding protein
MTFSKRRSVLMAAMTAVVAWSAGGVAAQQTFNLTIGSSHPTTWGPAGLMSNYFKPEVDKLLAQGGNRYKIVWKEAFGGTLFKFNDTMEAVRDGISDIAFVGSVWEPDTMPLSNVTYYAPFVTGDLGMVLATMDKMVRENPALRKEWEANNLKYLGAVGTETYHVWSKTPITKFDDLRGKRFNAPPSNLQWLRNTGAAGVEGGLPAYYANIQSGVVDGALSIYSGVGPFRLHEVASYIAEVDIGASFAGGMAINLERYNRLPKEVQDALTQAGKGYTREVLKITNDNAASTRTATVTAGSKVVKFSEAERLKWAQSLPDLPNEWAKAMDAKKLPGTEVMRAYLDETRKAGAKPLRDWVLR